jgi:putative peptidoglycan lipid II flippase
LSGGFFRSTSIVGAFTLISRVTGLLRDMVYSRMFGAGVLMDAFLVAFKIPNFMRRLFAEGAFSQAFVPASRSKVQRARRVRELVDGAGHAAWFLSVVTIVGVIAAPLLVLLFAPGFHSTRANSTSRSRCCAGRSRTCSSSRLLRWRPVS